MIDYSGHYDDDFDPHPKCPEPGCPRRVRFTGREYVHLQETKNYEDRPYESRM